MAIYTKWFIVLYIRHTCMHAHIYVSMHIHVSEYVLMYVCTHMQHCSIQPYTDMISKHKMALNCISSNTLMTKYPK